MGRPLASHLIPSVASVRFVGRLRGKTMRAWILAAGLVMGISPAVAQTAQPGWIADGRTGCRVWNHHPEPKETITWSGRCENGRAQGKGVVLWFADGRLSERIEGEMR